MAKENTKKRREVKEIIVAQDLTKEFGSGRTLFKALDQVNISINAGEFVSIMGPSGSGKSTLLNILGALDRPTTGKVIIDGVDTAKIPERKLFKVRRHHVGFIFQSFYLVPTLNALENVLTPVLPVRGKEDFKKRAEQLLLKVGLKDRMTHKPSELSGGEQQRVAIARSLILDPSIILADEPTGNLDSKTGADVFRIMQTLNQEREVTFVIVTHDLRLAQETDRTYYLKDGKLSDSPTVDHTISYAY